MGLTDGHVTAKNIYKRSAKNCQILTISCTKIEHQKIISVNR